MKSYRRDRLYAGTAKIDITPSQETIDTFRESGFGNYTGVHDPLYARILVLQAGERKILIAGNDLITIPDYDLLCERLTKAYGFKRTDMLINGTQNHLSLIAGKPGSKERPAVLLGLRDQAHDAVFYGVGEALKNMQPVTIGYDSVDTHIGAKYQYPRDSENNVIGQAFPKCYDNELFCLRVDREDGTPMAAVLNYGVQSVLTQVKESLVGGDFHGAVSRNLEAYYGDDFIAPYLLGAAGDSDPFVRAMLNVIRTEKGRVYCEEKEIEGENRYLLNDFVAGIQSNEAINCINGIRCTTAYAYFRSGEEYTEADLRKTARIPDTRFDVVKDNPVQGTDFHRIHLISISDEIVFVCGNSITCAGISLLVKKALPCKVVYCSVEGGIICYVADTGIGPTEFQNRYSNLYSQLESEHVYVESTKELYRTAE